MKVGKLPADILKRLLDRAGTDPSVLVGPAFGEDAAAVRFGGRVLVATSDPITFATDRIGRYAVTVNANDIAVMGAEPRYFLATILLPEGSSEADAEAIFDDIADACERIGVSLIGGHTEITQAARRAFVCGCMLGEVEEKSLVRSSGAKAGDALIMVGGIAIEGAGILGREAARELLASGVAPEIIESAKRFPDVPGICVLDYARTAISAGGVSAMHDPTEGGLATTIAEVAAASKLGVRVRRSSIYIVEECYAICRALGLDPLGLIASGSLLVAASRDRVDGMLAEYERQGTPASLIGDFTPPEEGVIFDDGSQLPVFERDEIARYFDSRQPTLRRRNRI